MGVRPLTDHEADELQDWRALGAYMAEYYRFDREMIPASLDRLHTAWRRDPRPKARPLVVVRAMGTMLGDMLARKLACEWGIVEHALGSDLGVASAATGRNVTPIAYLRKRVTKRDTDANPNLFSRTWWIFHHTMTAPIDRADDTAMAPVRNAEKG